MTKALSKALQAERYFERRENGMKRLAWGIIGSVLVLAFNVSATVAPSCTDAAGSARCVSVDAANGQGSSSAGVSGNGYRPQVEERHALSSPVSRAASPAAPYPLSSSTLGANEDAQYDDGCE
ncbi:putative non-ribosomal peptide synthetase [Zymobacter palmae]|uniref:Putative non-ribosomal peptide synthetase n=2 Tax=Zymobacter palmae TaxID=33074 RepID=A0A348HE32_9GAMM|nr:putative non-ribosomal peptide synthetase [Zymobacter palmae]